MRDSTLLGPWVRRFLLEHLVGERNLAHNTQQSYRDALCQLIPFASGRLHKPVDRLTVADVSAQLVRDFLCDIECSRRCSIATRNQRLATIHALARFIGEYSPEHIDWCAQVRCVPFKRALTPWCPTSTNRKSMRCWPAQIGARRRGAVTTACCCSSSTRRRGGTADHRQFGSRRCQRQHHRQGTKASYLSALAGDRRRAIGTGRPAADAGTRVPQPLRRADDTLRRACARGTYGAERQSGAPPCRARARYPQHLKLHAGLAEQTGLAAALLLLQALLSTRRCVETC